MFVPALPKLSTPMPDVRRGIMVAFLAVLVVATSLPAWGVNPEESRIAQTREELQAVRAELDEARSEADTDQIELGDADRQLNAAFDAVEAASQAVGRQHDAVRDAEARLVDARADLLAQRELMGERVGRLYRQIRPDPLIQVLDAATVTEAVQQSAYMSAIGRQDRAAVESLGNAETTVGAEELALEAEQVSLGRVLEEQQVVLAEVEEIREDKALIAAASVELVAQLQSRENHLEAESEQLAALAAQRQADAEAASAAAAAATRQSTAAAPGAPAGPGQDSDSTSGSDTSGSDTSGSDTEPGDDGAAPDPAPPPPPASGGNFSWPTSGSVTSGFGSRWGRQHEGIDIANGSGTAVAAARGGTVIQAGTFGGYGNLVLIAHGGGFVTAYAHLESIAVSNGQSVSTGTYLGGMGCTGSCTGTHLHFEIRANGTPVDPMAYL